METCTHRHYDRLRICPPGSNRMFRDARNGILPQQLDASHRPCNPAPTPW